MRQTTAFLLFIFLAHSLTAGSPGYWHGKERELRYMPEGDDFVIVNGNKRFNRALYGTNTAFRVETGDLPEFGLFMPGMGGNIQLGILAGNKSLWLNHAEYVESRYRAGSRVYTIKDPVLGTGELLITALAMADAEGIILEIVPVNIPGNLELVTIFGGASNRGFSRNGDLGVDDPEAFSLRADDCTGNRYKIEANTFSLVYGADTRSGPRTTAGVFSRGTKVKLGSPYAMRTVAAVTASHPPNDKPLLVATTKLEKEEIYIAIKAADTRVLTSDQLATVFKDAEAKRQEIAATVKIHTPDPYFNTLGGVLSTAADGIWDEPTETWQHGAVGWRMPLNGWRAAYVGDAIGWHDRARKHFNGYAASQITEVAPVFPHPTQDQELNLTRAEKRWGTQMYSNGYIARNPREPSRMHHYNMNLVYIDELLWHFNWTGDMDYVKQMWPVLQRHLEWEKRNFDPDNDGLYDSYACIWASDALQYNSGGVTFSSAYNYRANKMAAEIAEKIGEDPAPYQEEAEKILNAINSVLWLPHQGWWAEHKDFMGNKMLHPNAGIWTVYHAIDSDIHTPFQAYEATRYIDTRIPRIPVKAKGLDNGNYETIATTNWLPYSWSINNVAFAEVGHTSLAYWQAGRYEEAYKLFKSNILDGMYLGASPGNIGQVSFYDAARGECYRDFGDPVGVYSRVLVQGLFGILPDAMNDKLVVRPGFPSDWQFASIETPDIGFDFKRENKTDRYTIKPSFNKALALTLLVKAPHTRIKSIRVNNRETDWDLQESVNSPMVRIDCGLSSHYTIEIEWEGEQIQNQPLELSAYNQQQVSISQEQTIVEVHDPQTVLTGLEVEGKTLSGSVVGEPGYRTLFAKVRQGDMEWWRAISVHVTEPVEIEHDPEESSLRFVVKNNSSNAITADIRVNGQVIARDKTMPARQASSPVEVAEQDAMFGTNVVELINNGKLILRAELVNWNLPNRNRRYESVNIDKHLNASVSRIFKNEYLSPRSPYTTLQIPKQGIGEWCHPTLTAEIDDSGLRNASKNGVFQTPFGIPFRTPSDQSHNILFTTLWDNYPTRATIPLTGKSSHAYLLMAGSTNHMQCHVTNGEVIVTYKDGATSVLELVNPETWVPIEQDFYLDGYAFQSKLPRPYRVALKTGKVSRTFDEEVKPDEVYGRSINGGAGIVLDIPLDKNKELESIEVKSIANEVVIGLMAVTLIR